MFPRNCNFFCLYRGPGILLEGTYRKKVKHIIQDAGGKKVGIIALLRCVVSRTSNFTKLVVGIIIVKLFTALLSQYIVDMIHLILWYIKLFVLYIIQHRFVVFHIEFKHGCQRKFDTHGREIEPNFGQTGLVRTGYLHSSYSKSPNQQI